MCETLIIKRLVSALLIKPDNKLNVSIKKTAQTHYLIIPRLLFQLHINFCVVLLYADKEFFFKPHLIYIKGNKLLKLLQHWWNKLHFMEMLTRITGISIITPIKDVSITVFKIVLLISLLRFNNINFCFTLQHISSCWTETRLTPWGVLYSWPCNALFNVWR